MPDPLIPDSPTTPPAVPNPTDPPTEFNLSDLTDDKGNFKPDINWGEALKPLGVEEQAGAFAKYKNVQEMFKGHGHLNILASGKQQGVRLPTDENDTEGIREFRKALGVPEDIAGYGIKKPDNVPDEQWSDKNVQQYLNLLHKHNATPDMVKELIELNGSLTNGQSEEYQQEQQIQADKFAEEQKRLLTDEFGSTLSTVASVAHRAAQHFGISDELKSQLVSTAEGVKLLHKMGQSVGEDNLPNDITSSAKAAADDAYQIMTNPAHPLHERYRAGDDFVVRKVAEGLKNG